MLSANFSGTRVFVISIFFLSLIVAEYSYKIKLMETWNDDLKDKSSDSFKRLKTAFEEEVMWCSKTELSVSVLRR